MPLEGPYQCPCCGRHLDGAESSATDHTRLPSSLRIGPLEYKVSVETPIEDDSLYGEIAFLQGVIRLHPAHAPQVRELTLVHEILHAMLRVAGFTLDSEGKISVGEEELVRRLAFVLYAFLQDNGLWESLAT